MTFGEKVKELRVKNGLSQRELGERMGGITQQTVAQYEKAIEQPKMSTVRRIAEALGVYMSDLIDDWSSIPIEQLKEDFSKNYDSYSEKADTYLVEKELDSAQGLKDFLAFHGVTIDADMNFIFDDSKEKYHVQDLGMLSEIAASQIKILIEKFSKYQK